MRCRKLFLLALLSLSVAISSVQTGWAQDATGVPPQQKTKQDLFGKIVDDTGEPLPGVVVYPKGQMNKAVTSDLDGNYSILVPSGKSTVFVFQFMGMQTQEISASKPGRVDVSMVSDNMLDAAVSIGYGLIQKRDDFTGSAVQVSKDQIAMRPADRIDNLLVGSVAGMNIIEDSTNGRPSVKIRIRGDGSLSASNEPLWIIDGVPVFQGTKSNSVTGTSYTVSPLSYMNPDDIESITVLKDASTTTLYGADGSNGVILVTTKSSKGGEVSYNASVRYGVSNLDKSTVKKLVNGPEYLALAEEAWLNSGRLMSTFPYKDNEYQTFSNVDYNWADAFLGTGQTIQANFSAAGGSDKMKFVLSGGWFDSSSYVKGNDKNRFSLSAKTDVKFTDKFKMQVKMAADYNIDDVFSAYGSYDEILPILTPYNEDGSYRYYNYYSKKDDGTYELQKYKNYGNKLMEREYDENRQYTQNTEGSVILTYNPFKWLTFTSHTSERLIAIYESIYHTRRSLEGINSSDSSLSGYSRRSGVFNNSFYENVRVNAQRSWGKFSANGFLGAEYKTSGHFSLYANGNGFANDSIREITYADSNTRKGSSSRSESKSLSYIGNANVSYDKRYVLSANWRRQGNSSFSQYSRWGTFWATGVSWNLHHESFMDYSWLNTLRLKYTYGSSGNSRIDSSSAEGTYSINSGHSYGGKTGAALSKPANPGLRWEKTYTSDWMFDFSAFKNRVELSLEYYVRRTKDVLYGGRVSSIITDGDVTRNVGVISNKGIEFTFTTVNIRKSGFTWTTSINGAHNHNMIEELYKDTHTGFFDYIWIAGQSKDAFWLIRWAGVDPVTGAPMWYDINGDLTYNFSLDNRVFLPEYSKEPLLQGGISNDFQFGRFNLRVMFDYRIGGWDYITLENDGSDIVDYTGRPAIEELNHWTTPGVGNVNPEFRYKYGSNNDYNSTRSLWNTTYAQLRSITFGYRLPERVNRAMNVKNCTLSIIGDNLYLWTPGQSSKRNSYKTLKYSDGMRRGLSAQVSFNF